MVPQSNALTPSGTGAMNPVLHAQTTLPATMTDLRREFEQAAKDVQQLGTRPDNDILLKLYALYKQGMEGNLSRTQPGFFDFIGTAKHEAWAQLNGVSEEDAMRRYIALVQQLLA